MSKCTRDTSSSLGELVAWKESRWACGGGSRVTQPGYHSTGVPPSRPAQNRARSHGSAQSSTISLIQPMAASPPIMILCFSLTGRLVGQVHHPGAERLGVGQRERQLPVRLVE